MIIPKNKRKLRDFLNKKLEEIKYRRIPKTYNPELDVETVKAFGFKKIDVTFYGSRDIDADNSHAFSNKDGCKCFLYALPHGYEIRIAIDGVTSKARRVNVATLYRCMEEIGDITKEFRQLKNEMEEKEKHEKTLLEEFVLELRRNKN
jgi:hypothetical protein